MITTITPNPALDLTYNLQQLHIGHSHRAPVALERAGGKGLNVARVLAAQGAEVQAIAPLGGHRGAAVLEMLQTNDIAVKPVSIAAQTRRTMAIVTTAETTNINEEGQPLTAQEWQMLQTEITAAAEKSKVLVCSGSLPPKTPEYFIPQTISAAHAAKAYALVDVSGQALLAAARAKADLLKPNEHEIRSATGIKDPLVGAQTLLEMGAQTIVLSLGEAGMLAFSAHTAEVVHARLNKTLQGNTTGAGDAAVAAFARHYAANHSKEKELSPLDSTQITHALKDAVAWSAAAVLSQVAGEVDLAAINYSDITVKKYTKNNLQIDKVLTR